MELTGYRPTGKVYNLQFEAYPGLEVSVRGTTMGKMFSIAKFQNMDINALDDSIRKELFGFFASRIITWNVEHPDLESEEEIENGECSICGLPAGAPLPTTADGMFCLDLSFIFDIINGWTKGISQVNLPKEWNSSAGGIPDLSTMMSKLGDLQSH